MNLIKWEPFTGLWNVPARLNHLFGRPARGEPGNKMLAAGGWAPPVDISETDTAYLIEGEIPGVKMEDVKITIQDGMLTIQGERKHEKREKGKKFQHIECFVRSFRIPEDADETRMKTELMDGMLNVTLPKSKKPKSRAINVSVS